MEKLITGPLAASLEANRDRFNSLAAKAFHNSPGLDPVEFSALLRGPVQAIVDAVGAVASDRAIRTAARLFEVSLTLFSQGYLGPRSRGPLVQALWEHLLPVLAPLLALNPGQVAGALSNIAVNMGQEDPGVGQRWIRRLHSISPSITTVEHLLDASLVLAWKAGLPHFRESAIERWKGLPDSLKLLCMGIAPEDIQPPPDILEQALSNPWHPPHLAGKKAAARLLVVGRLGRFRGLGGQFMEPPLVAGEGNRIIAYDGEGSFSVWGDCFGLSLRRIQGEAMASGKGYAGFSIDSSGTVTCGSIRLQIPPLAGYSSFASTASTLAVTLPHSHSIYMVAPMVTEQG